MQLRDNSLAAQFSLVRYSCFNNKTKLQTYNYVEQLTPNQTHFLAATAKTVRIYCCTHILKPRFGTVLQLKLGSTKKYPDHEASTIFKFRWNKSHFLFLHLVHIVVIAMVGTKNLKIPSQSSSANFCRIIPSPQTIITSLDPPQNTMKNPREMSHGWLVGWLGGNIWILNGAMCIVDILLDRHKDTFSSIIGYWGDVLPEIWMSLLFKIQPKWAFAKVTCFVLIFL